MKRSEINSIIKNAEKFLASKQFLLPDWASWGMEEWKENKDKVSYITERMLGWDITDFGSGDFNKRGLFLFTLRNGKYGVDKKPYAEKIMIVEENQETPLHFHWSKMEDIINRGGGNLVIELYNATPDEELADKYHIVITTDAEDTSDESFRATRKKYIPLLHEYIKVFKMHYYNFYVRALPLDHYKVLDRDILFGEPEPVFSDEYTSENGNHYCLPHHQQEIPTVGKTIRSLFGHFFTKRKPFNIPR